MKVIIAGGTGLVGQPVVNALLKRGDAVTVVGRSCAKIEEIFGESVASRTLETLSDADVRAADVVLNLAGENVGSAMRWSAATVQEILDSRVHITSALAKRIAASGGSARLANASGISAYGYRPEVPSAVKDDWAVPIADSIDVLTAVTAKWEAAATENLPASHPIVFLRFGVVLCQGGGALGKMELPFRLCLGGRLGSGEQGVSWISLQDAVAATVFLIDHPDILGPVNLVANYRRQVDFASALAAALRRPCIMPAPGFALRTVLGSEMANALVLSDYKVEAKRLREAGFCFQDEVLEETLREIYATRCM